MSLLHEQMAKLAIDRFVSPRGPTTSTLFGDYGYAHTVTGTVPSQGRRRNVGARRGCGRGPKYLRNLLNPVDVPIVKSATYRKKKGARTLEQRVALLKADFWAQRFGKHFVQCRKCQKEIRLDKRSEYYPGLWQKHRGRCVDRLTC
ncbi:hypothetical protein R3P38DRAFT_3377867 [Favolaschia claudopus]|uniref:Uncharacterized protein n=1 Tax=Favolaschia claudopus TaxID=2862362 RepID=A0AAV9Z9Y2_9AGAR